MDEDQIRQYVEKYFSENGEALQEELKELQKEYVKRKLEEQRDEWERKMQEQDDDWFQEITELLKSAYK